MDARSTAAAAMAGRMQTLAALGLGVLVALVAVALRLMTPAAVGGEQAIFSFPAIVVATLLFGMRAGAVAALLCLAALWYFVIPPVHSFAIAGPAGKITLGVYVLVGATLVLAIGTMRAALTRLRTLNAGLERQVEHRTAERNRLWERSRELVAIVDRADGVTTANPALCALVGADATTLHGRSFAGLLAEEDRAAYRAAVDGGGLFEARVTGSGGTAWVSWSIVREGELSYLVGRDFTAEHECGEMLRQSQKMEFVGQLAGGLAHDFGNLLPPISMTLHLLGRRHADDPRTLELIHAADESVDRAGQLIRRLLELSRPSRLSPTVHAVDALLEEIAPLMRQVIGHRTLDLHVPPGLPPVRVDANQLDMALLNLAVNARDATADNGRLTLDVSAAAGQVHIRLSDDGAGMDAATLAHATEPFFSTKASGEGSGLGLPMVHNFAVAAGGRFALASTPGQGTRATISLPAAAPPAG